MQIRLPSPTTAKLLLSNIARERAIAAAVVNARSATEIRPLASMSLVCAAMGAGMDAKESDMNPGLRQQFRNLAMQICFKGIPTAHYTRF